MTNAPHNGHPDPDRLQAFLDGALAAGESEGVREHVADCARCRSELDAWEALFSQLEDLPEARPSAEFPVRVMERLSTASAPAAAGAGPAAVARRLVQRGRAWLADRLSPGSATAPSPAVARFEHLPMGELQDLLEDAVPGPRLEAAETHLRDCRLCRDELAEWRVVLRRLGTLRHAAPSAEFSERVMAHVRVRTAVALAQPTWKERALSWARGIDHRTRTRAAALAGAAVTPAVTLALALYTVFSHPMVTPGGLIGFVWMEARSLGTAGASAVATWASALADGPLAGMAGFVVDAPAAAAVLFAAFTTVGAVALWVLYRNVRTRGGDALTPHHHDGIYAH